MAIAAYVYRLVSLVPSLSPREQELWNTAGDWHAILNNPINAPYKALVWAAHFLPLSATFSARLPSILLVLAGLALFVVIIHRWYGPRSTVFGFFIFITSAWVLHIGRFAGPDIMYLLAALALIATHIGVYDHGESWLMLYAWLLVNIAVLFVPGMVWFVLFGLVLQAGTLWGSLRNTEGLWRRILWVILALAGLGTIAAAIVYKPELWRQWLGLPGHFASWHIILANAGSAWAAVAYRAPLHAELWLGNLPALGLFMSLMLLAGIAFYARHYRAARSHLLAGYLVLGTALIALGGVTLSVLIPTLYIIAIAGIAYVLHYWLRMFPRNQLARGTGIAIVGLAIGLSCLYGLQQYFVAWPHNPDTAAAYHYKLKH